MGDKKFSFPDINECVTENGGCGQICENVEGSYYCDCDEGYTLDPDGFGCTDVNECDQDDNGGCQQVGQEDSNGVGSRLIFGAVS